ncbi:hypothetical protein HPB48_022869 [Haemaphysalis longicornis]|uniref:Uncharacterized protein n=1 Tax=Haemaphysalis longicornis TaxID=44386 RepID=A0A9J6FZA8_HAELO|nr:hypothetical protein HPB48_022869 [Haemaphysalis longicornis]
MNKMLPDDDQRSFVIAGSLLPEFDPAAADSAVSDGQSLKPGARCGLRRKIGTVTQVVDECLTCETPPRRASTECTGEGFASLYHSTSATASLSRDRSHGTSALPPAKPSREQLHGKV